MAEQNNNNRRRQRRQMPVDNTYGHLQPQALDVEDAVLGALMIDKDAYAVVCELLRPESFYDPRHQMIYEAIRDLNMNERPVDVLTVTEQLAKSGNLEEVGGPPVIDQALKVIQAAAANTDGLTGISTGYYKLDDMTSGWQNSDLVIIAGRPAMGKTSFALSMAKNIAADLQVPMAFFSLEMSNVQLVNRLISNVCEIQGSKILNGQLQRDEWDRLDKHINNLLGAPLYVDDTPGLSVFELRTKARRLVREHGVKLIMIDYLQLMNANGMRFSSRQEEVSTISRSLKGLAKELDIPILALSQLNRGVESREGLDGKRPQLSDLRESGAIEQDADMVIFVHRPEYYHIYQDENGRDLRGMAQIIIAKHRKGATGDVLLTFRGEYTRFENPEDRNLGNRPPIDGGGEIRGSKVNGEDNPLPPIGDGPLPF